MRWQNDVHSAENPLAAKIKVMKTIRVRDGGQITLPEESCVAYRLAVGSQLRIIPLDGERFEVCVLPARCSIFDLMNLYAQEGEAPDIAVKREALGAALYAAIRTGSSRP